MRSSIIKLSMLRIFFVEYLLDSGTMQLVPGQSVLKMAYKTTNSNNKTNILPNFIHGAQFILWFTFTSSTSTFDIIIYIKIYIYVIHIHCQTIYIVYLLLNSNRMCTRPHICLYISLLNVALLYRFQSRYLWFYTIVVHTDT